MKCLVFAVLLLLQDPELDRLVQQLGDAGPARREEAARKIREIGPRAQEALEKARENSDPEVRARAIALLQHLERERLQTLRETKEHQKQFPRITIEMADAPLEAVLEELSRQSGWILDAEDALRFPRKVTLKGKNLPMIEALELIGLRWRFSLFGKEVLAEAKPTAGAVFGDGVRFSFSRRLWSPKGEVLGTIFETTAGHAFEGEAKWNVAGIKTDRDLKVETCAIHSPSRVYVAAPDLVNPQVIVKGTRFWYCPTPIEFAAPKNGDVWRIGPCQIIVEWPSLRVRMDNPLEERLLTRTLSERDIHFKAKPGHEKDQMGVGVGGVEAAATGVASAVGPAILHGVAARAAPRPNGQIRRPRRRRSPSRSVWATAMPSGISQASPSPSTSRSRMPSS
jgi:hypothetical protein